MGVDAHRNSSGGGNSLAGWGQTSISKDISSDALALVEGFFGDLRYSSAIPPNFMYKDSYSDLFRNHLHVRSIQRGKISCLLTVKHPIMVIKKGETNMYKGMHGGAVAAVAEMLSFACARTVVGKDKELFLGELSMSYLSAAPHNAKVVVDGTVVRSGRNLTVIAVQFKLEESGKLVYASHATFYIMPAASL